jgi:calcineurin-like phosphoesterase family protein
VHLSKIKNAGTDFQRCQYLLPNQYDVGVDFNNFKPISWKEVKNRIEYQIKNNTNCLIWIENENENN